MSRQIFYRYNPDTDNFERVFPTMKSRVISWCKLLGMSLLIGGGLFLILNHFYEGPSERRLREENEQLTTQYNILNRRLDYSLRIMEQIRNRDDNFYRVMMQMDPVSRGERFAGLDNEARYQNLQTLSDAGLMSLTTRRMDLLERQLYVQSMSFNQLRENVERQGDKLAHIPSVFPVKKGKFKISSGFGIRRDPIEGSAKFHAGIDMAAQDGTPVMASGDGIVIQSERVGGSGNSITVDHGYNYITRYTHLNELKVKKGDKVRKGEVIATVGSTGRSSTPHLHYEVEFKGEAQNPINYFFSDLSPEEYADMTRTADDAGNMLD